MKISILTPNVSSNCLGRAWLLAKILERQYEVEIIGPIFENGIWKPLANLGDTEYRFVKVKGRLKIYLQLKELLKEVTGDVIYASKPLLVSFGMGLLRKLDSKRPLILDIDDWQMGLMEESCRDLSCAQRFRFLASSVLCPYTIGSYWNNLIGERLARFADEITVSNYFLQKKFGGTLVWHSRDTKAFDPKRFDKNLMRQKYTIRTDQKVVMFLGTPKPQKGIEDLIKATRLLRNRDVTLALVGTDEGSYSQHLIRTGDRILGERFRAFGLQPFEKVPEFLAMSDVIVIPQKRNSATIGQIPAKVFDAMAMAKPIIATAVSDLPEILDGCGCIVEPEDPERLAGAIQYVFGHVGEAEEMGRRARQKCIEKYSWDAMERVLVKVFRKYEQKVA